MKLDDFRRYDVWMCGTMNKDTEHQMRCDGCHDHVSSRWSFCGNCGKLLDYETLAVRSYFSQGYTYNAILMFLSEYHGINMSLRTLRNKLKGLGLQRRNMVTDEAHVRQRIREELDGPGCMAHVVLVIPVSSP